MAQKKAAETVAKKKTQTANGKAGTANRKTGASKAVPGEKKQSTRLPDEPAAQEQKQYTGTYRREIAAFVFLFLAIFSTLGLFGVKALFIDLLCALIQGMIGYGFYIMIPAFLLCTVILLRSRGRTIGQRLACSMLTPVAFGSLLHLLICKEDISWRLAMVSDLFVSGKELRSGGLLSGFFAMLLKLIFSRAGAVILLIIVFLLLALASFRITVTSIVRAVQNRPRPADRPGPQEDIDPAAVIVNRVAEKHIRTVEQKRRARIADFDLPVDDPPSTGGNAGHVSGNISKNDLQTHITQALREPEPVQTVIPTQMPDFMQTAKTLQPDAPEETAAFVSPIRHSDFEQQRTEPANGNSGSDIPEQISAADLSEDSAYTMPEPTEEPEIVPTDADASPDIGDSGVPLQAADQQKGEPGGPNVVLQGQDITVTDRPYQYPPVTLLGEVQTGGPDGSEEIRINAGRLSDALQSFGIDAKIANVTRGPAVTRYELELDRGVKLSKLTNLSDDIALSLGASGVRISAIPDRISVVGVEVPNKIIRTVYAREVMESPEFQKHKSRVAFALGVNISGEKIVADLAKMPHLLIAGTTGSGKSVCINTMIISLLYRASPEEVRLIMIDPKMIELGVYNGIPHLLIPVVTDPKKASGALQWAVTEMMRRYQLLADAGVRDLDAYNQVMERSGQEKLPKIVIVIDELADLMIVAAKEVEESICRIAQLARAAGMHLVVATQRPSSDVITGLMKANVPTHIAFAVSSQLESRIILDTSGAEKLVGKGDMLYAPLGGGKPQRIQGCFISSEEVESIVEYVKSTGTSDYSEDIISQIEQKAAEQTGKGNSGSSADPSDCAASDSDELLPAAVEIILETGQASVSMLQRRLKLGYARAARIVDEMEERGIVGPFEGSKPRQLLITKEQWQQMQGGSVGAFLQAQELNSD